MKNLTVDLSKRELISAMAMQGLLATSFQEDETLPLNFKYLEDWYPHITKLARKYADALIVELAKTED